MSWTVDTAPKSHAWLGTALSAAGPGIGFIFGTVLSGLSAETGIISADTLFIDLRSRLPSCSQQQYQRSKRCGRGCVADPGIDPELRHSSESQKGFPALRCQLYRHLGAQHLVPRLLCHDRQCSFTDGQPSPASAALTYMLLVAPYAAGGILCGKLNPRKMLLPLLTGYLVSGTGMFAAAAYACPIFFTVPPCSMRLHHGRDLLFGAQAPHGMR